MSAAARTTDLTAEQIIERAVAEIYGSGTLEAAAAIERCHAALEAAPDPAPARVDPCNTGSVAGFGHIVTEQKEEMRAFDALPAEIRAALRDACVKWGAGQILDELRRGRTTRTDLLRRLEFEDRKLRERAHA